MNREHEQPRLRAAPSDQRRRPRVRTPFEKLQLVVYFLITPYLIAQIFFALCLWAWSMSR